MVQLFFLLLLTSLLCFYLESEEERNMQLLKEDIKLKKNKELVKRYA